MEDKDLKTWGEQLSQELGEIRTSRRSKRWRCPPDMQSRVVSYTKVCRDRGEPYFDIAVRLGLVESTLTRWFRTERAKEQPGFRSVSIVRRDVEETTAQPIASQLRLLTPQGYRVEGLDAQTLAYLLRILP